MRIKSDADLFRKIYSCSEVIINNNCEKYFQNNLIGLQRQISYIEYCMIRSKSDPYNSTPYSSEEAKAYIETVLAAEYGFRKNCLAYLINHGRSNLVLNNYKIDLEEFNEHGGDHLFVINKIKKLFQRYDTEWLFIHLERWEGHIRAWSRILPEWDCQANSLKAYIDSHRKKYYRIDDNNFKTCKSKKEWEGPLYKLGEEARKISFEKGWSYKRGYQWAANIYKWKGRALTPDRIQKAYYRKYEF